VHTRVAPLTKLEADIGVILVSDAELEPPEQKRVIEWVRHGGRLIVVGNSDFYETGEVEMSMHGCGTVRRARPNQDLAPLKLAVLGEHRCASRRSRSRSFPSASTSPVAAFRTSSARSWKTAASPSFRARAAHQRLAQRRRQRALVAELIPAGDGTIELVGPWTGDGSQSPVQSLKAAGLLPVMLQLFGLALLLALRQGTSFGKRRDVQTRSAARLRRSRASRGQHLRARQCRSPGGGPLRSLADRAAARAHLPGTTPDAAAAAAAVARRVGRPETQIVQLLVEAKTTFDEQGDAQGVNHKLVRELEQLSLQAEAFREYRTGKPGVTARGE